MPRFRHDCAQCEYLETQVIHGRQVDWYRCPPGPAGAGAGTRGSMIARLGDDGSDYWSMPIALLYGRHASTSRMAHAAREILAKPAAG